MLAKQPWKTWVNRTEPKPKMTTKYSFVYISKDEIQFSLYKHQRLLLRTEMFEIHYDMLYIKYLLSVI